MFRAIDKWLIGYLRSVARRPRGTAGQRHLVVCVADHFEPVAAAGSTAAARAIVNRWVAEYPAACGNLRDADGHHPRHTFFYPAEEYNVECVGPLSGLCERGYGEVEIHLHHRNDTREGFRNKLTAFRDTLAEKHGWLGRDRTGRTRYGFIHGNWALCNSRPDGDWCGVNGELGVLAETGCYADFTFPSAPSATQPRMVNAIYRAIDTPDRPRACDSGVPAAVRAGDPSPESLLIVTGPLAPDWRGRKFGFLPRLDNGAVTEVNPATPRRFRLWARQGIHVEGRPEWVFVKVHMHGAGMSRGPARAIEIQASASKVCGGGWQAHFVSAREMYNIVRAAERGHEGNPGEFRDFEISKPRG